MKMRLRSLYLAAVAIAALTAAMIEGSASADSSVDGRSATPSTGSGRAASDEKSAEGVDGVAPQTSSTGAGTLVAVSNSPRDYIDSDAQTPSEQWENYLRRLQEPISEQEMAARVESSKRHSTTADYYPDAPDDPRLDPPTLDDQGEESG